MRTAFAPDGFPDCKMDWRIMTPCAPVPKTTGSVTFKESTTAFADSDMGDGSMMRIDIAARDKLELSRLVKITWLAWNEFEYESVEMGE